MADVIQLKPRGGLTFEERKYLTLMADRVMDIDPALRECVVIGDAGSVWPDIPPYFNVGIIFREPGGLRIISGHDDAESALRAGRLVSRFYHLPLQDLTDVDSGGAV
ncbi:MAG TPA: hypothetical protein VFG62_06950 [Rhodopila sp.]|jgi:hypothetical protein|nr:hypothetical protein [Rhodopila sp.]